MRAYIAPQRRSMLMRIIYAKIPVHCPALRTFNQPVDLLLPIQADHLGVPVLDLTDKTFIFIMRGKQNQPRIRIGTRLFHLNKLIHIIGGIQPALEYGTIVPFPNRLQPLLLGIILPPRHSLGKPPAVYKACPPVLKTAPKSCQFPK